MSDWRQNPNLVECFEAWREMLRDGFPSRAVCREDGMRARREALGLTTTALGVEAGYSSKWAASRVSQVEHGTHWYQRIADTLARLEAERAA